jgi:hypothetical protein
MAINQLIICKMCGKKYQIYIPKAKLYAVEGVKEEVMSFWRQVDFQEEAAGAITASELSAKYTRMEFIDSRGMEFFRCRCGKTWRMEAVTKAMRYNPGPTTTIIIQL